MTDSPLQLRDIRFVLFEHLKAQDEVGLDKDTLDAFVDAATTFVSEFLAPINAPGDKQGCRRNPDGTVTTAKGYAEAMAQWREGEWGSMRAPTDFGGQGLPQVLVTAIDEPWCRCLA